MESDTTKPRFTWEVGPAAMLAILQIVVMVAGGVWTTSTMFSKSDEHTSSLARMANKIDQIEKRQEENSNSFTGAQTAITFLTIALHRVEDQVATLRLNSK